MVHNVRSVYDFLSLLSSCSPVERLINQILSFILKKAPILDATKYQIQSSIAININFGLLRVFSHYR